MRLGNGTLLRVTDGVLNGHTGPVSVGIRPEKLHVGPGRDGNSLSGEIIERAYVGVSTQYVVKTSVGNVTRVRPGSRIAHAGRAAGAVVRTGRNVRRLETGGDRP